MDGWSIRLRVHTEATRTSTGKTQEPVHSGSCLNRRRLCPEGPDRPAGPSQAPLRI